MVINNWGHSQSALEHYMYSLKDRDKVWQWSCPAHLRQWLADNLQETSAGAGVIKSSLKDKAANWPCSNHWKAAALCSVFAFLPAASSFSPSPGGASACWQGWRVTGGMWRVQAQFQGVPASLLNVTPCSAQRGWPWCWWGASEAPHMDICGATAQPRPHLSHSPPSLLVSVQQEPHIFICSVSLPTQPRSLNRLIP